MSDPDQYTVGLICALKTEYVAARAFLDKKHARPETLSPNDNNHYTLGEIGGHRVVIAVLPDGEYGTSSVAGVARDMLRSFPNIRFGLMVGIGGGVPLRHDIRLGDIIVSSPRNGRGGLLQYDFGKELQGQKFHQTGFLNQPPPILRTAVAGLQAQYEEEGHQLKESVQTVLEGNKRLKRKYERPPIKSDRLYESHFVHSDPQANCGELCDSSKLIRRPPRTDEDDDPAIHYGLIASGNRVIKDALFRDELAASQDVLCFEMEAAGLLNHFPCLVIRGVCDYADSHKSKEWQGYAAMTAAAYAKDLLYQIIPQRVDAERKASDVLNDIKDCLENVSGNVKSIRSIAGGSAKRIEDVARSIDLKELQIAEGAEFGTYTDQHEEECLQGTREDLLHKVEEWATLPEGKCMFWLKGLAGTGKSTISRTVARNFQERGLLGASFFFKRGEGDRGNATRFFPTIARQIFTGIPELRNAIQQVLQDNPRISAKPLKEQFDQLVHQPLHNLYQSKPRSSALVIVIDALDECEGDNDIQIILQQLSRSVCLRFFITSRPELPIRLGFRAVEKDFQDLILHEIPEPVIEHDISLFLKYKLTKIRKQRDLGVDWPGESKFMALLSMSLPLFIFAATICRLFEDHNLDPEECLLEILEYQNEESRLEKTYLPALSRLGSKYDGTRQMQLIRNIREVLGIIILLEAPLSIVSLSSLTGITIRSIESRLSSLHSVVHVPDDKALPIRIFHLSFRDFLLDPGTREKTPLWIDKKEMERKLSNYCLSVMRKQLKKNICNLPNHGIERRDIDAQLISHHLPPELQYACRYWIHHIILSRDLASHLDYLFAFLEVHFLHWMEAMSILGFVSEVIRGIITLKSILQRDGNSKISEFLDDAKRFVLKNSYIADIAPLQIYTSGLMFAPKSAMIKKRFEREYTSWINQWPREDEGWGPDLQTLEGHSGRVASVAFSPNGRLLASGSYDRTIKLWDPATGALKHTLEGHSGVVASVAFSPTDQLVASGSHDGTIKLWDPNMGTLKYTIDGQRDKPSLELRHTAADTSADFRSGFFSINSVAFSPNGELLASGVTDGSIKLWDPVKGALKRILQDSMSRTKFYPHCVREVAFSRDGQLLAACSDDKTIKLWDPVTGVLKHTVKLGAQGIPSGVAFSPDGRLLASCHFGSRITLWDPVTGALKSTLSLSENSVCFSPDGKLLASGGNNRIELWDPVACEPKYTLERHSNWVVSVAFSPDGRLLASGDYDNNIKLWDLAIDPRKSILDAYTSAVDSVAFSPDGRLLASCRFQDETIQLWKSATGLLQDTVQNLGCCTPVIFSLDSKLLAAGSTERTVRVWYSATGELKHTLKGHISYEVMESPLHPIAFSPNSQLLAFGPNEHIIDLWDVDTGVLKLTLKARRDAFKSIAFSPDSQLLAITSNRWIDLWDLATGKLKKTIWENDIVQSIAFLPDGKLLASGSGHGIKFWDPVTGALKGTPNAVSHGDSNVDFPRDTLYLAARLECFAAQDWRKSFVPDFLSTINKPSLLDDQWVTIRGQRVLWLPPDYRPNIIFNSDFGVSTIKDGAIALGCRNGRVHVITFSI